jgi:hypothetical protein
MQPEDEEKPYRRIHLGVTAILDTEDTHPQAKGSTRNAGSGSPRPDIIAHLEEESITGG